MAETNPYAPPPIVAEAPLPGYAIGSDGLWRQGNQLVMLKGAPLPPRCIKTNQPSDRYLNRNLVWYPSWAVLLVLFSIPIGVIVILIIQKKATIQVGLSEEWLTRRRTRIAIAWGIALAGLLLFIAGIVLIDQNGAFMIVASLFVMFGALIYGNFAARLVYPQKIDDRFIWLNGVCPEYLEPLPIWTGPR